MRTGGLATWLVSLAVLAQGAALSAACADGGAIEQSVGSGGDGGTGGVGGTSGSSGSGGQGGEIGGAQVIHVSPLGNDNADGKTPDSAVQTINEGIQRAVGCGTKPCDIHVMKGTYEEQVTLADGVHIKGGYGAGFKGQDTAANPVVITSTEAKTIIAEGLTKDTSLESLTVRGADLSELTDGSSSYAVWVHASGDALNIVDARVEGGKAAAGADGAQGEVVACSALGGTGGVVADCSSGPGEPGDADGDPTSGGEGGPDGSDNCPSACPLTGSDGVSGGTTGKDGGDGANGLPGGISMDALGAFTDLGIWQGTLGSAGERGKHGTGGGGGGAGGTKRFRACFGCGTLLGGPGGKGGDGGCGGDGGAPGGVGGGAFGIVLIDSNLKLEGSYVSGGLAGNGGKGGDGAIGATGAMGAGGEDGGSQKCGAINYSSAGGAAGGNGGKGGAGGGGAGGNGGVSIAIALIGKAVVTEGDGVIIDRGTSGNGGPGGQGGNDAQPGIKGETWGSKEFLLAMP
ncbi:MAG: hypothetical protein H6716_07190 [Polyangiaceae bacterium]|nr:hypothetical protein [Polyangiaceae bacterium]